METFMTKKCLLEILMLIVLVFRVMTVLKNHMTVFSNASVFYSLV